MTPNVPPATSMTLAPAQRPAGRTGHVSEATHHLRNLVQRGAVLVGARQEALERAIKRVLG